MNIGLCQLLPVAAPIWREIALALHR